VTRGVYSPDFRTEALALMRRIGRKPAARQLGISTNTLHRWEKPDLYRRQLRGSAAAKRRRRQPCVRGCGRLTSYDRPEGVCAECYRLEHAASHGTRSRYTAGCRCDLCRAAQREEQRARRRSGQAPTHGLSGYKNYGCRCPVCTQANTVHCREYMTRRAAS
jgi:hypothetical protein